MVFYFLILPKVYIYLRTASERIVQAKPPSAVRARPPIPGTGEREPSPHPTYTAPKPL